jgi:hypothetical protein
MIPKNLSYYDSVAYESSEVVKATPGTVYRISGFNAHTSPVWIQLHDAASLPADTAVPKIIIYVVATANFDFDMSDVGRFCQKGIVVCASSTGPTKTISGNTTWFNIQYT